VKALIGSNPILSACKFKSHQLGDLMTIFEYDKITRELRYFFSAKKGFTEVPAQSRKSILAACEDPTTVSQYIFSGQNWPLPQTGQMWLERELLENPEVKGVFCQTTSYRNEPFPIEGRHDKIFPMFEFESHGDMEDLVAMERELCEFLGFSAPVRMEYEAAAKEVGSSMIEAEQEEELQAKMGDSISLEMFPQRTSPFWNMKRDSNNPDLYHKVDVLLHGMETIGSAVRSCDPNQMREDFLSISDGEYAKLLFNLFGETRVMEELEVYLALPMFPRYGGGIGVTRLIRGVKFQGNLLS
jgi:aspartyl/asparaginyl-tRNA synthetase